MTHQKRLKAQPHEASNLSTTRSQSLAMTTMQPSPTPQVPDRIPSQESLLSPEWIHAITILLGHPLTSKVGQHPGMDHLPSKPQLHQICFQMGSHTV